MLFRSDLQRLIEESLNHRLPEFREPKIKGVEKLTIDDSPALFYLYGIDSGPFLHIYKDGVKIKIHGGDRKNPYSKEELIKVAKSLKRVK